MKPAPPWRALRHGSARGWLLAGCLLSVRSAFGGPYLPETAGAVLFLEDFAVGPDQVAGMLTQWRRSGRLERVAGAVFGRRARPCAAASGSEDFDAVVLDAFEGIDVPILADVDFGHSEPQLSLPLGATVRLSSSPVGIWLEEGSMAARDKRWMKHVVAEAGIATARFRSLSDPSDEAAVARLAAELEYPVVVKPAAGFGTMSTHLVAGADEFATVCRSFTYEIALGSRELTVESFVEGEELHVDAYWEHDRPQFLFVSRYFAPRLTVLRGGPQQDGGELLSRADHAELYAELEALAAATARAMRIRETMIHLEVFRQPDGKLVFSEIATRVGGGWVHGLISQAMGRSVWAALAELSVTGRTAPPRPLAPYLGVLHLRPDAPGRIVDMPTLTEIEAVPGVLEAQVWHGEGDVLTMSHPSEWVAFAFIGAQSAEEFDRLIIEIPKLLPISTVPVAAEPAPADETAV